MRARTWTETRLTRAETLWQAGDLDPGPRVLNTLMRRRRAVLTEVAEHHRRWQERLVRQAHFSKELAGMRHAPAIISLFQS